MKLQLKLVDETNVEEDSQVDQEVGALYYFPARDANPPPPPPSPPPNSVGAEKAGRNHLNMYIVQYPPRT